MGVDAKHPLYGEYKEDWDQMSDTYAGERKVKSRGTTYLPATSGMIADGMQNANQPGMQAYEAYRKRAVYHDFVKDAITTMVGVMHRKPPQIELPAKLEPLRKKVTSTGEGLNSLLRRINEAQLLHSRFGLLVDVPTGQGPQALPYIATYSARAIGNWDYGVREEGQQDLEMLVLEETEQERGLDFEWEEQEKFRVLLSRKSALVGGATVTPNSDNEGFLVAVVKGTDGTLASTQLVQPQIAGKTLPYIPFTFVNASDLAPEPEAPVLIGLSNLALAVYRGEADYRQTLFMQGQETLVVIGAMTYGDDDELRVGAGSKLEVPLGGDAKYIGVSADGLAEQRLALENDKEQSAERGARLLDFGDSARQSGDALRIRVAARTTTLTTVARTGGEALEHTLRQAAEWVGADPDQVKVEPNMDFTDDSFTGQDLLEFMQAKQMGAPVSMRSIHRVLKKRDITEKTFEDEMDEISNEDPLTIGGPGGPDQVVPPGGDGRGQDNEGEDE